MALAWAWLLAVPTVVLDCIPPPPQPLPPLPAKVVRLVPIAVPQEHLLQVPAQHVQLASFPPPPQPQPPLTAKVVVLVPTELPQARQLQAIAHSVQRAPTPLPLGPLHVRGAWQGPMAQAQAS